MSAFVELGGVRKFCVELENEVRDIFSLTKKFFVSQQTLMWVWFAFASS